MPEKKKCVTQVRKTTTEKGKKGSTWQGCYKEKTEKKTEKPKKKKLIIKPKAKPKTESKDEFLARVRAENKSGGLVAKSIYATSGSTGGYLGDEATKFKEKSKASFKRKLNQLYRKSTGRGMKFTGRSVQSVGVISLVNAVMAKTDTSLDTIKKLYGDYIYNMRGGDHY